LAVIFQNPDDRDALLGLNALKSEQARMIRGSGVALADYPCVPEPEGRPVVVMAARLLRDKGVFEFVEAARLLRGRGLSVEMRLIGSPDPGNPTSVTQQELDQWESEGHVELLGYRRILQHNMRRPILFVFHLIAKGCPKAWSKPQPVAVPWSPRMCRVAEMRSCQT
jgi:glycosyltransferase involved in cell wall biosynthesis